MANGDKEKLVIHTDKDGNKIHVSEGGMMDILLKELGGQVIGEGLGVVTPSVKPPATVKDKIEVPGSERVQ